MVTVLCLEDDKLHCMSVPLILLPPPPLRALHLALKHKTHIDTVLAFREKYLTDIGCQETYEKFLECRGKV